MQVVDKIREWKISFLAGAVIIFCAVEFLSLVANFMLLHHDIWWHIAIGDWIREQHKLPQHDFWSFTAGDHPFYLLTWLWDISLSWLFAKGGLDALVIFYIWLMAFSFALLGVFTARVTGKYVISVIVTVVALVVGFTYALPVVPISVSGQTLSLGFSIIWLVASYRLLYANKPFLLFAALAGFYLLWVNCHGGFLISLTITGAFFVQGLMERRRKNVIYIMLLGVVCLFLCLANPLGINIFKPIIETAIYSSHAKFISEFARFSFEANWFVSFYIIVAALSMIFGCREFRKDRLLALRILSVFWLYRGINQQRDLIMFVIFSLPLLVNMISRITAGIWARKESKVIPEKHFFAIGSVLLVLTVSGFAFTWKDNHPDFIEALKTIYPIEETAYLKKNYAPQKIYNNWNFGGYLIYATRGEYPVYIDGRGGVAYPREHVKFYQRNSDELLKAESAYKKYGAKLAMTRKEAGCQAVGCDKWKLVHEGNIAYLWEREE